MIWSKTRTTFLIVSLLGMVALALLAGSTPAVVYGQAGPANFCSVVADLNDALWRVDFGPLTTTRIGVMGGTITRVEGIVYNLDGTVLYGAHDDHRNGIWGTIDTTTGTFTTLGPIGPGNGIDPATGLPATDSLNDVDALAIHPLTGDIWAITQDPGQNKIFRIDPVTGSIRADTFGSGLDYAQLVLTITQPDIDDLAIDPDTGRFFAIANDRGTNDRVFEVAIDGFDPPSSPGLNAALGTMTATEVAALTYAGNPIVDMEGFAAFNDGTFYGTTGDDAGTFSDHFWIIDPLTGAATPLTSGSIDSDGVPPLDGDYESVACLTAGANLKSGIVFEDLDGSGTLNGAEVGYDGATVSFWRDNGNGTFDGAPTDTLIQSAITSGGGRYSFQVATEGVFFAVVDQSTLPAGTSLTTVGSYTVNFVGYDNALRNNHFGFGQPVDPPPDSSTPTPTPTVTPTLPPDTTPPPDPPSSGTPSPASSGELTLVDPALSKTVNSTTTLPGDVVQFILVASNTGATPLTGVIVTDAIDGAFFEAVIEVSTTKGTTTIIDDLLITVQIGDLAVGEAVTITVLARVRRDLVGPQSTRNIAIMDGNEYDPLTSAVTVGLVTLPSTGYPPAAESSGQGPDWWRVAGWGAVLGMALLGIAWRRRRA